jgi:predicted RNase H-like HicB family nuclease
MKGTPAMKTYRFAAVIEKDEDGYYAFCPELQGCCTSGETFEEARANLTDAIRLHVEDRLADGEEIKPPESVNLTSVEVAV